MLRDKQINAVLELARRQARDNGDQPLVAQLALQMHEQVLQLESLLRAVEHYLESGQDCSTHAHLLKDIERYRSRYQSGSSDNERPFGLE